MHRVPMTAVGAEKMRRELDELKALRPAVIDEIAKARALGDLRENSEYHAARERQGLMEARIKDLESKLSHSQIIDVTQLPQTGRVVFGVTVHLLDATTDKLTMYQIVGDDEADIKAGKISVNSPVARALVGKEEGDKVEVTAPGGVSEYFIEKIEYI